MFRCMECGRKFKTVTAAERASYHGCPKCNSTDIDLDVSALAEPPDTRTAERPPADPVLDASWGVMFPRR